MEISLAAVRKKDELANKGRSMSLGEWSTVLFAPRAKTRALERGPWLAIVFRDVSRRCGGASCSPVPILTTRLAIFIMPQERRRRVQKKRRGAPRHAPGSVRKGIIRDAHILGRDSF